MIQTNRNPNLGLFNREALRNALYKIAGTVGTIAENEVLSGEICMHSDLYHKLSDTLDALEKLMISKGELNPETLEVIREKRS